MVIAVESELRKASIPVVVKDSVFGTITLDRDLERFNARASFRGTEMTMSFDTMSTDELSALIQYAKPLWKEPLQQNLWLEIGSGRLPRV